jgi:hypothetical protein
VNASVRSSEQEPEPQRGPRWLLWSGLGVALLLALVVVGFFVRQDRIAARLAVAVAEQDSKEPGWRLQDFEAARLRVPDQENSALVVQAAFRLLPSEGPLRSVSVNFEDLRPNERLDDASLAQLRDGLAKLQPAVKEARKVAGLPAGRNPILYTRNPLGTLLPHVQNTRAVVQLLKYDAWERAEAGDPSGAMTSCRAALNTARSIGDEPFLISYLVRVACGIEACRAAERVLALGEPDSVELESLQKLVELEEQNPGFFNAMKGERAFLHETLDVLESGESQMEDLGELTRNGDTGKCVPGFFARNNLREQHPMIFPLMAKAITMAQTPSHERGPLLRELDAEMRGLPKDDVIGLVMPGVLKIEQADRRYLATLRGLRVVLAVERYRRAHGDWPDRLEALMPDLIAAVPLDPYDGKPLRYRRLEDSVLIYMVGPDGVDNGGALDPQNPLRPGTDIGYQLWEPKARRQPPQPKPAEEGMPK